MTWSPITDNLHRGEDLPIIGDDISQIGRIMDLWASPCSPTPMLWAQAFWHALPIAFWSAFKPELWDIDIASKRHRKRRHPALRFLPKLGISDALVQVQVPRWAPFVVSEAIDRALFYFLLADAAEDLAINWMSLAYQWQGCRSEFPVYADRQQEGLNLLITNDPNHFIVWGTEAVQGCNVGTNWTQPLSGQSFRVGCQIEWSEWPISSQAGTLGGVDIVDIDSGALMANTWPSALLNTGLKSTASAYFRYEGGVFPRIGVRLTGEPGFISIDPSRCYFNLAADNEDAIAPDP